MVSDLSTNLCHPGAVHVFDQGVVRVSVKTQRIVRPDGTVTHTVIGPDFLPLPQVEDYLTYLRVDGASPNTIRSYARGLALWMSFLDRIDVPWDGFSGRHMGEWMTWLRTGDLPGDLRIGAPPRLLAPATIQIRMAAVLSFYRYHAAAHGLDGPHRELYTPMAKRGRNPHKAFLTGIVDRGPDKPSPMYRVRTGPKERTPVLTPAHVQAILDACATQRADGSWAASLSGLRSRLYFALLAETGMRPGEALALRHTDIHLGAGTQPAISVTPRQDHPRGARVKSGQPRRIYVGDDLEALYSEYVWQLVDAGADLTLGDDLSEHFVFVNAGNSCGEPFAPLRMETIYAAVRSVKRRLDGQVPPEWTPHWFRHTHATALLLSGCPPHVVMRRLGHLDVQTTLSTYGWVTEDAELRAVSDWKTYATGWKEALA